MVKNPNINHISTKKTTGSVVPVGSKVGKILLNSIDASKIMDAVRAVASGSATQTVKISNTTIKSLSGVYNK
ncbi:hypothetical protein R1T16_14070 [Flavobacterium sp. DG1-102-2]|uniref:hypothetical protein n=1 Tax=Flavobacterium sp. DG1-102-2 TaxID=3081663 RepID=UPI00294A0CA2|nr:hypothetical protein [Flavobacterium sp. DG1-102-2]MDV6169558.1 hypothetical protein [Flavobacterium sp. DG1-102-2]